MPLPIPIFPFRVNKSTYRFSNIVSRDRFVQVLMYKSSITGSKLLYCIEKYGVVIVVGQTGCGKTTRKLTAVHVSNIRDDDKNFHNTFFRPGGRMKVMS